MTQSLRKHAFLLALTGLAVTGLVVFTVFVRQGYENKVQQLSALHEALNIPVLNAKTNYKNLPSGSDQAVLDKEVRMPVEGVRTVLQNLYEGKDVEFGKLVNGSEAARILIKLAWVEVDRTLESLKGKTMEVDFGKSISEIQHVESHFAQQATNQLALLDVASWLAIIVTLAVFAGITAWNYRRDKRSQDAALGVKQQLEEETSRVETLSNFIEAMATGNYSIKLQSGKDDELSRTLVTMRDKLKMNAEEDQRRNWTTGGLAQIGEILRSTTTTSSDLYDSIVKFVVKYTKSNQAGLFILNDDDSQSEYLELVACYAFERKKFLTKRLDIGQGLVGQCFLEKEKVHLREIPQDYLRITSGLGGENANSCLMVPLKVNEKILGVLELASFNLYQDFEIELVEKLAETIASTISSVKTNGSTRILLERTQQQAEEMKSQEEEMRQNMEELSATQEEMQRKEKEYIARIEELESQMGLIEK